MMLIDMQAMASLLLRTLAPARLLNCPAASRSYFSWLPARLQTASPLQAHTASHLGPENLLCFLTKHPLPILQPVASFKSKVALKKRCKDCYFVRRRGRLYVYCKTHPRHKQRKL
ncbi:39S ribosomal protein L36, mitochondrial [Sphaerodactylus townsendi]|uniref:39S ribosomal protein L36, mitochondrial n=1 Tax=Sphaerodactylus townsendi TaxID=933632 RepID=UPI002026DE96|nr:39S ribosomal protein L36, mitochondrial [Sphaerodactylus townsendi]